MVSDASLESIGKLTELKILWLSNTSIKGTGFKQLTHLNQLKELHLDGTALNLENLDSLTSLHQLEQLNLDNTNVTRRVKRSLGLKMPNTSID